MKRATGKNSVFYLRHRHSTEIFSLLMFLNLLLFLTLGFCSHLVARPGPGAQCQCEKGLLPITLGTNSLSKRSERLLRREIVFLKCTDNLFLLLLRLLVVWLVGLGFGFFFFVGFPPPPEDFCLLVCSSICVLSCALKLGN